MLRAKQMESLPEFFSEIPDPRRAQGRRHRLTTVLGIASGAILCGMRGYKAIYDWAKSLGNKARRRFGCRYDKGRYIIPSEYVIRDVLIRVKPDELDHSLQRWNELYAAKDKSLAIDGKTMCNAIDEQGRQTQIMGVVGHTSKVCYTQKKVCTRSEKSNKATNEIKVAIPLLEDIDIKGKEVTADALLTQRELAKYIVE